MTYKERFREWKKEKDARVKMWKNGEQVYENGHIVPHYEGGYDGEQEQQAWDPSKQSFVEYFTENLKRKQREAYYNALDPTQAIPEKISDKASVVIKVFGARNGLTSGRQYNIGPTLADSVSDAAWRKYLHMPYDKKFLPDGEKNGIFNTVRLPEEIEKEIPTDTTMLKDRIKANQKLLNFPQYRGNEIIIKGLREDERALNALRETYRTGKKVTINEQSFNSRKWMDNGFIKPTISPLNALQNFEIQYDKDTNTMKYFLQGLHLLKRIFKISL